MRAILRFDQPTRRGDTDNMEERAIAAILSGLRSRLAQDAWAAFLESYSALILQVVHSFERDPDHVSDCFLFVCEQLSRKRFRRLRSFRPQGRARFSTWLRAVVRNLCLDWHRKEFGRHRVLQSVARLPALEQDLFRGLYQQGLSLDEAFAQLRTSYPTLTKNQLDEAEKRIRDRLSPRQLWLLSRRLPRVVPLENGPDQIEPSQHQDIPDLGPNPETLADFGERQAALSAALSRLSAQDRLLLRLRFEQELTLQEVARIARLGDAQKADRRLREILERLRKEMT